MVRDEKNESVKEEAAVMGRSGTEAGRGWERELVPVVGLRRLSMRDFDLDLGLSEPQKVLETGMT